MELPFVPCVSFVPAYVFQTKWENEKKEIFRITTCFPLERESCGWEGRKASAGAGGRSCTGQMQWKKTRTREELGFCSTRHRGTCLALQEIRLKNPKQGEINSYHVVEDRLLRRKGGSHPLLSFGTKKNRGKQK